MKKKISLLMLLLTAAIALLAFSGCSSNASPYDELPDDGYYINKCEIKIDASAGDRSMRITEKYEFVFNETYTDEYGVKRVNDSHGFIRDFAISSGEKIRNLKVYNADGFSNEYNVSHSGNGILSVRVGHPDRLVQKNVPLSCVLEYTMITPKHAEYEDALVVNAIGQGWSCIIKSASVKVILPENTNKTPLYMYGKWGESINAVEDNIVSSAPQSGNKEYSFAINREIPAYHGLTLYYFMPKGALGLYSDFQLWIVIGAGIVLLTVAIILKLSVGKSSPLAPVVNYYPPKSVKAKSKELPMDPVQMGYLIDNTCQGSDVTSLIFYFASRGYLEIEQPKEKDGKGTFTLRKLCELPEGLPKYQYTFFNKIFKSGDSVTAKQLTNKTYSAVQSVQTQVKARYSGKLYETKAKVFSVALSALTAVFAFLTVFLSGLRINPSYIYWVGVVSIFPIIIANLLGMFIVYNWLKLGKIKRTALLIAFGLVTAVASLLLIAVTYRDVIGYAEIISLASFVAAVSMISPFIARRTDYYTSELDNVLGFKEFLQAAEKDKLETLLAENPQYYYDILPYANVLGVSDIWEDKFKGLTMEPPSYYRGFTVWDVLIFNSLYRHSYRAYSSATVSRPSSSSRSGGGFSGRSGGGGGFSGGGFGGGGGRRW